MTKSKSRSANRDPAAAYASTAQPVKSKSPALKTGLQSTAKKRTQSRQGSNFEERLNVRKSAKRKSPAKPEENPTFKPQLTKKSKKIASKRSSPQRDGLQSATLQGYGAGMPPAAALRGSLSPMQKAKSSAFMQTLTPASNRTQQPNLLYGQ